MVALWPSPNRPSARSFAVRCPWPLAPVAFVSHHTDRIATHRPLLPPAATRVEHLLDLFVGATIANAMHPHECSRSDRWDQWTESVGHSNAIAICDCDSAHHHTSIRSHSHAFTQLTCTLTSQQTDAARPTTTSSITTGAQWTLGSSPADQRPRAGRNSLSSADTCRRH